MLSGRYCNAFAAALAVCLALGTPQQPNATRAAGLQPLPELDSAPVPETPEEMPVPPGGRLMPEPGNWSTEDSDAMSSNYPSLGQPWCWQWLPDGLVWRSYLGSPQEPRFAWVMSDSSHFDTIWDATLGARVAIWRYGTPTAYRPDGWEFQFQGAAHPRLWPTRASWPLISTDYRVGLPLVYALGPWQFKTGYHHISSHLGDEFMILNPTFTRINYMRDSWMMAVGYYYTPDVRLYAEADYAFGVDGGAQPWEFQFGVDYSPAVRGGAPFAAFYGNLRQELNYGGFFVVQAGWQVRGGPSMRTFRAGVEYANGASTQYEFFNQFEQRVGFGLWYDF